jgi:hypothetical protein
MKALSNLAAAVLLPSVLLASGCASVTGGSSQSVAVQTRDSAGKEVTGANCELSNGKGRWLVTTPGSTTINRSNDDMHVLCNKTGEEPGRAEVVSITKNAMYGNILLGGPVGAFIDHSSGAAYEYPSFIQLVMGRSIRIETPDDPAAQPATLPVSGALQAVSTPAPQPAEPQPTTKAALPPEAVEGRLKELKRLRDAGLITEDVYQDQQRRALGLR